MQSTTTNTTDHQLEETTSITHMVKHSFSHRWTIEDFSVILADTSNEYPLLKSAPFSSPTNSAIQFVINFYPKGDQEGSKYYLSIYLELASLWPENEIVVCFKSHSLDSDGMKHKRESDNSPYTFSLNDAWGRTKFMLRSELLNPENNLLNEDRMIILCEVTVFDGTFTVDPTKYMPSVEEVKVISKKQILVDLNSLFEQAKQTDVIVVVDNGKKKISAHKFVLVGASSVFVAMFKYDTTEKQSGIVTLTDVSVEVGELFIRYLYTGKVNQLEAYAEELFVVADKYDIDLLKRMCVQSLCSQMSTSSVCQLLLLSDRHSSTKLQLACIEYITNHAKEVIHNEDWKMMSQLNDQLKVELFRKLANKHSIAS